MAQIGLLAGSCFLIAHLLRLFLGLEAISVSPDTESGSEVRVPANYGRKNLFLYRTVAEKKPIQNINHGPMTEQDWIGALFDGSENSKLSFDDSKEEMQPGIWGKRSESYSNSDEHLKVPGLPIMWKLRDPSIWGEQVYPGQGMQMYTELISKGDNPGVWREQLGRHKEFGKGGLGASLVRRMVQNMEETRRIQKGIFSLLYFLIRKRGCPGIKATKRGQRRQTAQKLGKVFVKSVKLGNGKSDAWKTPFLY